MSLSALRTLSARTSAYILAALLASGTVFPFLQTFAAQPKAPRFRPDRIIIKPKADALPGLAKFKKQSSSRTLKSYNALGGLQVVQLSPGESVADALERYRASGLVEFAEPDYKLQALVTPNDPQFINGTQWALRNSSSGRDIHAVEAWDTSSSASNIIVAVIDTGIRYTHQDLAANMWVNPGEIPGNGLDDDRNGIADDIHGINTINRTGDPMDDGDHGTHVAGIIGAVGNNGKGISGVAWNVKLMACKFLDSNGDGDTSDLIEAIDYARRMGAHVINASFGGPDYSSSLYTALQNARNAGIVVAAAAGNEMLDIDAYPMYPASYPLDNIVSVAGTSRSDNLDLGYSNWGANNVDLCAPGSSIYSTWGTSDSSYMWMSGTSMAAPHVAGAVALMRARFSNMSHEQIIAQLLNSVDVLPGLADKCRTSGRLNLAKALGPNPAPAFNASVWSGEPPLAVTFTNNSIGEVQSLTWNFGDGSHEETAAQPTHVFTSEGEFKVRLTVVGANSKTNSIEQTVRVMSNYKIASEPYAWVEPSGMTRLLLSGNGVSAAIQLPFSFPFYRSTHDTLYVSANGVLGFNPEGLNSTDNSFLPTPTAPNEIIAPYWDDLNPAAGGSVYAGAVGSAPNRRFVVTWLNVPRAGSTVVLTFQAILEEATGDILFQYRDVDRNRGAGRSATIGIENSSGDLAAIHTYNGSPNLIENRTAVRVFRNQYRFLAVDQDSLAFNFVAGAASASPVEVGLQNSGNAQLNWNATAGNQWLVISNATGALGAGETTQVQIGLDPSTASLAPGAYETTVTFANTSDGSGTVEVPVTIVVQPASAPLEFTPASTNVFSGGFGGPFGPGPLTLLLRNPSASPITWSSSADADWVQAEPAFGSLGAGESVNILVGLTPEANALLAGTYNANIEFIDVNNPADAHQQPVRLQVNTQLQQSSVAIVDGQFRAQLAAPADGDYAVEYSTDLRAWQTLTNTPATSGSVRFDDPVGSESARFYRLRLL